MTRPTSLKLALKTVDTIVRHYVLSLEAQNTKLQKEIVKLEAEKITSKNKIAALEKQLKKGPVQNVKVSFVAAKNGKPA